MLPILAAEILFALAVFALQEVPRGHGRITLAGVLLLMAAIPALMMMARRTRMQPSPRANRILVATIAFFATAQLVFAVIRTIKPKVLDIATTTLAAIIATLHGGNPYALPIDPAAGGIAVAGAAFHGYKYLPAMMLVYAPACLAFGIRGTVVTNVLLQGGTAAALRGLAARTGGAVAGLAAALLYLSQAFLAHQLFTRGVNDLAAVLPLLLALLLVESRPGWSGFFVGLSIAAKLMPGLAALPCLVPPSGRRRRFAVGLAVGLLPIVPFVVVSPRAFVDNIVLFNALRPVDDTSWLYGLGPGWAVAARAVALAALAVLYAWLWRRPPTIDTRIGATALAILLIFAVGPDNHHNYYLWFIPFFAVMAAGAATGAGGEADRIRRSLPP